MKTQYANPRRIESARLAANMSRADLAYAIRQSTGGQIKATERGVRGWEKGEYKPSDGVIPAIAQATGKTVDYFYASDEDEEDAALLRDLEQLPLDLRRRLEARLRTGREEARVR